MLSDQDKLDQMSQVIATIAQYREAFAEEGPEIELDAYVSDRDLRRLYDWCINQHERADMRRNDEDPTRGEKR